MVGKGSPKDIYQETDLLLLKERLTPTFLPAQFTGDTLKHFLVDNNIGIDCSGFAYYVLDAESVAQKKGSLDKHLSFPLSKGILKKIISKMRPAKNTNVATLAHEKNSHLVNIKDAAPGDMITMRGNRDHVLVIHQIEYQNFVPITLHYSHSIAWPSDGEYGHGVRQGIITILDIAKPLTEQQWIENEKQNAANYTHARALESRTEIRRLKQFMVS